jgi:hypothetical protein
MPVAKPMVHSRAVKAMQNALPVDDVDVEKPVRRREERLGQPTEFRRGQLPERQPDADCDEPRSVMRQPSAEAAEPVLRE